jgi:hypothetical protein
VIMPFSRQRPLYQTGRRLIVFLKDPPPRRLVYQVPEAISVPNLARNSPVRENVIVCHCGGPAPAEPGFAEESAAWK